MGWQVATAPRAPAWDLKIHNHAYLLLCKEVELCMDIFRCEGCYKILVICSLVSCPVFDCFMQKVLQHAKIGPGDFVVLFTLSKKLDSGNTW